MARASGALVLCLVLAGGCVQAGGPAAPEEADACGASGMQRYVGGPETVLHKMKFSQPILVLRPGDAAPADVQPIRMLIYVDAAGIITRVVCG